jgi:hypothetical protein
MVDKKISLLPFFKLNESRQPSSKPPASTVSRVDDAESNASGADSPRIEQTAANPADIERAFSPNRSPPKAANQGIPPPFSDGGPDPRIYHFAPRFTIAGAEYSPPQPTALQRLTTTTAAAGGVPMLSGNSSGFLGPFGPLLLESIRTMN